MIEKKLNKLEKLINAELSSKISESIINFNELLLKTSINDIIDVIKFLKLDDKFKFKQLIDIAAIDYPNEEKRFELVYLLLSIENNLRLKISINFETNEKIPSIVKIFPSANWMEREIFDMYGIKFINHPDSPGLKRGGVLNIVRRKVELKCPAESIPDDIVVDLAGTDIGTSIKISSVKLASDVVPTITDRDFVIATVAAPTVIKEPEKLTEVAAEGAEGEGATAEGAESTEAKAKDGDPAKKDEKGKEASAGEKKSDEKKPAEKKPAEKK